MFHVKHYSILFVIYFGLSIFLHIIFVSCFDIAFYNTKIIPVYTSYMSNNCKDI